MLQYRQEETFDCREGYWYYSNEAIGSILEGRSYRKKCPGGVNHQEE
jgi:hypothetical protein